MKIEDINDFMNRIKNYYQEFSIDESKITEWYEQLKIYDIEDLNAKLNNHIRGEYGDRVPTMNYLLKGLIPSKDKGQVKMYIIECPLCHKEIQLEKFNTHYNRCSAVNYINIKSKKIFNAKINEEQLYKLNQKEFDKIYDRLINKIIDKVSPIEAKCLVKLIYPNQSEEVIEDILNDLLK